MKKLILLMIVLVILSSIGCSQSDNDNEDNFTNQLQDNNFIAQASYDTITVGKSENGEVLLFENEKLTKKFKFIENSRSNEAPIIEYIDENTFRIVNPKDKKEFIEFNNLDKISENSLVFDINSSSGHTLKDVVLSSNNYVGNTSSENKNSCPFCIPILLAIEILEVVFDGTTDSDCVSAQNACVEAGGLPTTTITQGWFGQDCSVECTEKNNEQD